MRPLVFASFAALSVLASALPASGHARLMTPAPLTQDDNAKAGPCGCYFGAGPEDPGEDGSPSQCPGEFQITTLQAGTELTVTWEETVNHNGDFRLSFSSKPPADTLKADVDAAGSILMEMPDENTSNGGEISQKIVVPNEPCELCTIQLRQFMIGAPQPYYYSCAAVKIVADDPTSAASSGAGGSGGGNGNGSGGGGNGGAGSGAGTPGGQGGGAGSTGAGMADPLPKIEDGCSVSAAGLTVGDRVGLAAGALAIAALSVITGARRDRSSKRRRG